MGIKLNIDGSMVGKSFSGDNYKGGYPSPNDGKETYEQYYKRVEVLSKEGFHKGDLSWDDWYTYCLGSPGGGGQYVSDCIIGNVPDHQWIGSDDSIEEEGDENYDY
jgi:hypothetical protein